MNWLILISVILIIGVIIFAGAQLRKPRPPRCPECHGKEVSIIGQKVLGQRHFVVPGGKDGGQAAYLQLDLEIIYYCKVCDHQFSKIVTQTNT